MPFLVPSLESLTGPEGCLESIPFRVFMGIGGYTMQGMANGIAQTNGLPMEPQPMQLKVLLIQLFKPSL